MVVELDHIVWTGELYLRTTGMISRSALIVIRPRGSWHSIPITLFGSGHTRKKNK